MVYLHPLLNYFQNEALAAILDFRMAAILNIYFFT
jgi:hypothetical protein